MAFWVCTSSVLCALDTVLVALGAGARAV
jgi:hypothetical protein